MFAFDPQEPFEYVCRADRDLPADHPGRPRFKLRGLTAKENADIQDRVFGGQAGGSGKKSMGMEVRNGLIELMTLRRGLIGVENLHRRNPAFTDEHRRQVRDARENPESEPVKTPPEFLLVEYETETPAGGRPHVSTRILDMIPADRRTELANAITERGGALSEDEEGNS